jgi:hypothetical protein
MDPIKEAFSRAKNDINELKEKIVDISVEIKSLKDLLLEVSRHVEPQNKAFRQTDKTENNKLNESLINKPNFWASEALKTHTYSISTRNEGVSTDRPTDQQTDKYIDTSLDNPPISTGKTPNEQKPSDITNLLNSLDSYKKELRNKFKKLTKQEMLVFSSIYQLEEEGFTVDYSLLSKKLSLSESSIRDYVQRSLKKGVHIDKIKVNNKKINLSIPSDIKKIASLNTLISLREI